jgi:hypothetical protein
MDGLLMSAAQEPSGAEKPSQSLLEGTSRMDLVAKLPFMEDAALAVLHENAERLEQSGTKAQKSAAAALLPALETELANRRAAKLAASAGKRAASRRVTKRAS